MSPALTQITLLSLAATALSFPFRPSHSSAPYHFGNHTVIRGTGGPTGTGFGPRPTLDHSRTGADSETVVSSVMNTIVATESQDSTVVIMTTVDVGAGGSYASSVPTSVEAAAVESSPAASSNAAQAGSLGGATGSCNLPAVTITTTARVTITVTPSAASGNSPATSSVPTVGSGADADTGADDEDDEDCDDEEATTTQAQASSTPTVSAGADDSVPGDNYGSKPSSRRSSTAVVPTTSAVAPISSILSSVVPSLTISKSSASAVPTSSSLASSSVVSSYVPVPTTVSGSKRGLTYNNVTLANLFSGSSSISWAYDWSQTGAGIPSTWEFVPMLWSDNADLTKNWKANVDSAVAAGSTCFLAFNEPDLDSQANMSVNRSVTAFQNFMNPIKEKYPNVRLGTPAVTNGANGMGIDYLVDWQTACKGNCSADFAAVHWYESPTNVQYFKDHITEAYNRTGLPVWVTEFGTVGGTDAQITTFLGEVLPWMDAQPWIERYSFFMAAEGYMVKNGAISASGTAFVSE